MVSSEAVQNIRETEIKKLSARILNVLSEAGLPFQNLTLGVFFHSARVLQPPIYQDSVDNTPNPFRLSEPAERILINASSKYLLDQSDEDAKNDFEGVVYAAAIDASASKLDAEVSKMFSEAGIALAASSDEAIGKNGKEPFYVQTAINADIVSTANRFQVDPNVLRENLVGILNGQSSLPVENAALLSAIMHYRLPSADIVDTLKMLQENDIEGFLINTAQYIAELDEVEGVPNADGWRKAQMLITFYGPLLESIGLSTLSTMAYSSGYEYLYKAGNESDIVDYAKRLLQNASDAFPTVSEEIKTILEGFASFENINIRLKSLGSIMEKLERKMKDPKWDGNIRSIKINDLIGAELIIDDPVNILSYEEHVSKVMKAVIGKLSSAQYEIEEIEWRSKNFSDKEKKEQFVYMPQGEGKKRKNAEKRVKLKKVDQSTTGYQGVHIVVIKGSGEKKIRAEVQIHTRTEKDNNSTKASHVFYKNQIMFGPLGELFLRRRQMGRNDGNRESLNKRINTIIFKILYFFKEQGPRVKDYLNNHDLSINHSSALRVAELATAERGNEFYSVLDKVLTEMSSQDVDNNIIGGIRDSILGEP